MIEHIHFERAFSSPSDIGYKSIARSLSDLAAMGASPLGVTLSIAVPKSWSQTETENFLANYFEGAVKISREFRSPIVGGDLSRIDGPLVVDVAAIGEARETNAVWTRAGAKPGDLAYVTGPLGLAAFALAEMKNGRAGLLTKETAARHLRPRPRFDAGELLSMHPIHASIDISDGLVQDALQVCVESKVSLDLDDHNFTDFELHGGDDYELLLALPKEIAETPEVASLLTALGAKAIGRFIDVGSSGPHVRLRSNPIEPLGHDSFRDE